MNREKFKDMVGDKIFSATFTKKDNSTRKILGRLGVTPSSGKGLSDKQIKSDIVNNYIRVCDFSKRMGNDEGFRILNLNTLKEVKCKGNTLQFVYK